MKRVLIITYYWPPAGGPGVQRWLKMVKYFRDFGVEPIVYVPENPNYPLLDENFRDDVPSDIEIIKHPINEPYGLAEMFSKKKTHQISSGIIPKKEPSLLEKLMLYVRGNFFIPDARVGWVSPSVKFLTEYIPNNNIDVVITSGPPHSLHLIGMQLKENLGMKWIADFRDPWTTIHYHKSLRLNKSSERKHKEFEVAVLNSANLIVVTSPSTKKEFQNITEVPIEVVTNGFDITRKIGVELDIEFSISHIGSLLSERNPEVLWHVLAEISNESAFFKKKLLLKFAGAVSEEVKESLRENGLLSNAIFLGYVSHAEALKLQHKSQVLLLVEIDSEDTKAIIPGKLFEYLAAARPVVALGPKGSDIETIVLETNAGSFFEHSEKEKIKSQILQYYEAYKDENLIVSTSGIEKYSRRELAGKMATLVKTL